MSATQGPSRILRQAAAALVLLAVGLIGGNDVGTGRLEYTPPTPYMGTSPLDELGYLAFAYAIRLGPAGKEEVGDEGNTPIVSGSVSGIAYMGQGEIQALACRPEFRWSCNWVIQVMGCESTFRTTAVGLEVRNGVTYYFYGLLQIYHPDPPGPTNVWLLDPYTNLVEGHIQYVEWVQGIREKTPWPNCPN